MTSDLLRIKQAAEQYEKDYKNDLSTNDRLKELVAEHGIEKVAAASGLKIETLILYTTRTNPPKASPYAVDRAVHVLNNL